MNRTIPKFCWITTEPVACLHVPEVLFSSTLSWHIYQQWKQSVQKCFRQLCLQSGSFFFLFSSLTMAYFYYQNQNVEKVAGKQLYSSLCSLCFDGCILVRIICSVRETAVGRLCCNGQVLHMCFVCRRMFAITTGDWKTEKR